MGFVYGNIIDIFEIFRKIKNAKPTLRNFKITDQMFETKNWA